MKIMKNLSYLIIEIFSAINKNQGPEGP